MGGRKWHSRGKAQGRDLWGETQKMGFGSVEKGNAEAVIIVALSLCGVNILPPPAPSSSPHPARAGLARSSFARDNKHPQAAFSCGYVVLKILFKLEIF